MKKQTKTILVGGAVVLGVAITAYTVYAQKNKLLNIREDPNASGGTTDPAYGLHVYPTGTEVVITAIPEQVPDELPGHVLSWTVDGEIVAGEQPSITITMDRNHTVMVSFYFELGPW